jgi:hypothetical protein
MARATRFLTPEHGLIFRITHVDNLSWIFAHGLHCSSAEVQDRNFVSIGNDELIDRRRSRQVPIPPYGTLRDYVPFYFTPFSPMFYNIHTGYAGIVRRRNDEIAILVSSLGKLEEDQTPFVFTDRHALLETARFFSDRSRLGEVIDYDLLERRDFRLDPEHPESREKYQAEALVFRSMDVSALVGIACHADPVKARIEAMAREYGRELPVKVRQEWYF